MDLAKRVVDVPISQLTYSLGRHREACRRSIQAGGGNGAVCQRGTDQVHPIEVRMNGYCKISLAIACDDMEKTWRRRGGDVESI